MSGAAFFALSASGAPFSVSVPANQEATTSSSSVNTIVAATIVGGIGPFTYSWSVSGDIGVSIVDPSVNPVTVRAVGLVLGEQKFGLVTATVTDTASGASVDSNTCTVTFTRV